MILETLRRYADFESRAMRREYWSFLIAWLIAFLIVSQIADAWRGANGAGAAGVPVPIFLLAFVLPGTAVAARRLHDADFSAR